MPNLERYLDFAKRVQHPWRLLTRQECVLPSFVIVGTQKGGTTYLYSLLSTHPQIVGSARKEVQSFSLYSDKGLPWYRAQFPAKHKVEAPSASMGKPVIAGEASPYYMFHPRAIRNLAATLPDVKIIVLLRNPVTRAVSHYNHNVERGFEKLGFEEALAAEPSRTKGQRELMLASETYQSEAYRNFSYVARGDYLPQLEEIVGRFPHENVLVLASEPFFKDPAATVKQVCGFLGVEPWTPPLQVRRNSGMYNQPDQRILDRLKEHFEPINKTLYAHVGTDYGW